LYGGLDLSQEGRISLPTTAAALSRLAVAYHEAAVATCDAALAAAGGRGSPADDDKWQVPSAQVEARARGSLGACLTMPGERQRCLGVLRQAVALWREAVLSAAPGQTSARRMLADQLSTLGGVLTQETNGMVEGEVCLREALALGEGMGDVMITGQTLRGLTNLCGEVHAKAGPAEAEPFRSRLNQLLVQMGRSPETSCSICLETLAPPADGSAEDAAEGGGSGEAGGPLDSSVHVLRCLHQFHRGCLMTWQDTAWNQHQRACPVCKR